MNVMKIYAYAKLYAYITIIMFNTKLYMWQLKLIK